MAPMGIRLSPLGMAVFCLLGLGVLYHLYSGFLAGRFAFFMLSEPAAGGAEPPRGSAAAVDLRELLAVSVLAAVRGGEEVKRVREGNVLNEKAKGKTREGAEEKLTSGDLLSNRRMYHLLQAAFPGVQVGDPPPAPAPARARSCFGCLAGDGECYRDTPPPPFFFPPSFLPAGFVAVPPQRSPRCGWWVAEGWWGSSGGLRWCPSLGGQKTTPLSAPV